jgi:hypothetical protein
MWLGVDLSTGSKRHVCSNEIGLWAENMLTILGSIVINMIGVSIRAIDELKNLHFANE